MRLEPFKKAAALVVFAAVPAVAAAQGVPPSQKLGFYVGAGGGLTTVSFDNASFGPPPGFGWDSNNNAGAVKGFLGWRFHKYFGIEGGYYYLGKFTNNYNAPSANSGSCQVACGSVSSKLDAWVLDAVGYIPLTPNFSAIGRVGAVNAQIDNTQLVGTVPANLQQISDKNTNFTWGIGAQFDLNEQWGFRAEYEYLGKFGNTNTGELRANLWSASALFKF